MCIRDSDKTGAKFEIKEIPADMMDKAKEYREKLLDTVADLDEELMEKILMEEELTHDEIISALRKGTIANEIVPVCCGSSYRNKGVQPMLDLVVDLMPSPLDIPAIKGTIGDKEVERHADVDGPFAALAFKIVSDPFVGKLAFIRVYSGSITAGSYVYNSTKEKRERMGRIMTVSYTHLDVYKRQGYGHWFLLSDHSEARGKGRRLVLQEPGRGAFGI